MKFIIYLEGQTFIKKITLMSVSLQMKINEDK